MHRCVKIFSVMGRPWSHLFLRDLKNGQYSFPRIVSWTRFRPLNHSKRRIFEFVGKFSLFLDLLFFSFFSFFLLFFGFSILFPSFSLLFLVFLFCIFVCKHWSGGGSIVLHPAEQRWPSAWSRAADLALHAALATPAMAPHDTTRSQQHPGQAMAQMPAWAGVAHPSHRATNSGNRYVQIRPQKWQNLDTETAHFWHGNDTFLAQKWCHFDAKITLFWHKNDKIFAQKWCLFETILGKFVSNFKSKVASGICFYMGLGHFGQSLDDIFSTKLIPFSSKMVTFLHKNDPTLAREW